MSEPRPLEGLKAVITGASRGLGAELAIAFRRAGADLLLVARTARALDRVGDDLADEPGGLVVTVDADVATDDGARRVIDAARSAFDRLDVLVNNAAVQGPIGPAWDNDWEAWRAALEADLFGPVRLCRLAVPWMAQGGGGSIINLAGGGATGSRPNFSAYAVAKTGLVRFTEVLADEARPLGVRVNAVAPGVLPTDMLREVRKAGAAGAGEKDYVAAHRALAESDPGVFRAPAGLCVFLASAASRDITGRLISAVWDPWRDLPAHAADLAAGDIYTLRRITPKDRDKPWG